MDFCNCLAAFRIVYGLWIFRAQLYARYFDFLRFTAQCFRLATNLRSHIQQRSNIQESKYELWNIRFFERLLSDLSWLWLFHSPNNQTMERNFSNLPSWAIQGYLDVENLRRAILNKETWLACGDVARDVSTTWFIGAPYEQSRWRFCFEKVAEFSNQDGSAHFHNILAVFFSLLGKLEGCLRQHVVYKYRPGPSNARF